MNDDLILFNKPISRKMYIIYVSILIVGFVMLELLGSFLTAKNNRTSDYILMACLLSFQVTLMVFLNIILFILSCKRFRDIGASWLLGILAAIVFVQIPTVIVLMFIKRNSFPKTKESIEVVKNSDTHFERIVDNDSDILYQKGNNESISKGFNQ